jgi:toxin CcdB
MAQFDVYQNKNSRSKAMYPLLVDVQAELLDELQTRVVIPLTKLPALVRTPIGGLVPTVKVSNTNYLLLTPELAGVPVSSLGKAVANILGQRLVIIAALDLLITGV